jgi:small-conductance mechanosensitive channel
MNQLLSEIAGWFGFLQRLPVVLQLIGVLAVLLACRWARRRRMLAGLNAAAYPALALGLGLLFCLLLALIGQPWGLALFLLMLVLGWYGLELLRRLLARLIDPGSLKRLDTQLLRPAYLVAAGLALVEKLDSVRDLAVIELGQVLGVNLNLGQVMLSLAVFYVVLVGSGPPAEGLAWLLQRLLATGEGSRRAMALMLRYLIVGVGLLTVALHLGLNTTALIAVAGGLSVGLGFGIKEVFSNFVSGIWLLFEGSVRPGEVLFIDGDPCEVRHLGLRAATLWRDRDNAELVIPNQVFFTSQATTYTGSDRMRRSQVLVGAAYRHDPTAVCALLEATAREVERVLPEPAPKALVLSYGDSAVNYALRFWIANPMDNSSICSEVNQAVWHAFERNGIEIPFPQRVVHGGGAATDSV